VLGLRVEALGFRVLEGVDLESREAGDGEGE